MKRITRRQARSWLSPMRACLRQMLAGEVDAINGYPVTRLHHNDDYARVDFCIAGFRALLDRLCPEIGTGPMARLEKRLAHGVPVTAAEIEQALAVCTLAESALLRHPVAVVKAAVMTEQIVIELESLGLKDAA
jgi:hypothetical protein